MKTFFYSAESRGHANHGWLNSYHSFSFANYHNPERMNFGVLRVLNDDTVSGGQGFGQHPHKNMEIVSIPLKGDLEHKDSMGNTTVIKEGDVQVMSAGTGVFHSEYNKNKNEEVKFLQIWVIPKAQNVSPRYDQISTRDLATKNSFYQILSPNKTDQGVWVHQDAWFSLGEFETGITSTYTLNKTSNGLYIFILEGEITIGEQQLKERDAIGIWETNEITLTSTESSKVLLMEVPMN
ncbi:pirin family protein [Arenibacter sp. F26102]|uniref:pirin family protein n=1 Tax=Arenibacter sp. F26102 TaxID=2926416 RepID=UPI001FF6D144|nr:pirin family protein [Arenibacter sp. F26102]MCK0145724.1 pirin family protein [Arenibacter sp. F26102]